MTDLLLPLWFVVATALTVGLVFGSFLNVVAYRVPAGLSLNTPSRCDSCETPIKPHHNLPIVGYLALRGRSACCKEPIGLQHLSVEVATGALALLATLVIGVNMDLIPAALILLFGIPLAVIDIREFLLPHKITWTFGAVAVPAAVALAYATDRTANLPWIALGAVGVPLVMFAIIFAKPHSMGDGDAWLMVSLGALLGLYGPGVLVVGVLFAYAAAAVVGITMSVTGRAATEENTGKGMVPLGPFLLAGAFVALLWGREVVDAYLSVSGLA